MILIWYKVHMPTSPKQPLFPDKLHVTLLLPTTAKPHETQRDVLACYYLVSQQRSNMSHFLLILLLSQFLLLLNEML